MLLYQALITAITVALLLNTLTNLRLLRSPVSPARAEDADGEGNALVSILVPARNEARSIAACVESLARQDYPWCEILVLDDQSEDETARIVADLANRYPNVRLLRGAALPANWHGKAYACAQLARAAHGDWLLFVDADTVLTPGCVSTTLRHARARNADLLTMIPRIVVGSLGEALILPIIPLTFVAFLPLGLVTNHPSPLFAGAFGPFLLFRRTSYQRIGGHAAVRTDIVEDMRLSQLIKRDGGRVVWLDGTALMRIRLYHSFAEAWGGIAKSAFAAISYSLLLLLGGVVACAALFWGPYLVLAAGLVAHPTSALWLWLPAIQILLLWTAEALALRRLHLPAGLAPLQGLSMLAIVMTTVHAAIQTKFGGGIVWKGRTYQFDTRHQRWAPGAGWVGGLALTRLLSALPLTAAARMGRPYVATALLLLGWTTALLEHQARKGVASRWTVAADVAAGAACLGYLELSGLVPLWLAALMALVLVACLRWFAAPVVATLALVFLGALVLIATQTRAPNEALLGWFALIALVVVSRSLIQVLVSWFQRPHSS